MNFTRYLALTAVAAAISGCVAPPVTFNYQAPTQQPEGASGLVAKPGWTTQRFAVAAANPLATDAGYQVLKAGGSAVDAAVAVQMVLTLVEPQSSGIGGGAFLLHADGRAVEAFDGRETAPAASDEAMFLRPDGKPGGTFVRREGKDRRFVYIAIGGAMPGLPVVSRRAKIDVHDIPAELLKPGAVIETTLPGRARDGTPACATVRPLTPWRIVG